MGQAAGLGALTSVLNLVAALVRGKVGALILGPAGMGIVAELSQAVALAFTPNSLAAGPALIRGLASAGRTDDSTAHRTTWRAAFTLALATATLGFPLAIALAWHVASASFSTPTAVLVVCLAAGTAAFTTQQTLSRQALISSRALRPLARSDAIYAILSLVFVSVGVLFGGIPGYIGGGLLATLCMLVVLRSALHSTEKDWSLGLAYDRAFLNETVQLGSAGLINGFLLQGSLLLLLNTLRTEVGPESAGLFQACWALAHVHATTLLASFGQFIFPRYAAAASLAELQHEVQDAWRFMQRISPSAVLAAIALSGPALALVFSRDFSPAAEPLRWMIAALALRTLTWTVGGTLLYRNEPKTFLIAQSTYWISLTTLTQLLIPQFGLLGVGWATFGTQCVATTATISLVYWRIGIIIPRPYLLRAAATAALTGTCAWLSSLAWTGGLATLALATAWFLHEGLHHVVIAQLRRRLRRSSG